MPANNLSENLENLSQSQGYKKFLGMPLIGSIASRKKKEEAQKENKDNVSVPRKLLDKLLTQQQQEPQVEPLQAFNKDAEILTNIYNVMRMDHQTFMKNMIADKKFDKKLESIKESRTKELIEIFAGKKREREQKEKVKKEIEDLKKKLDELEKKKEARKAAEAPTPAPAPTTPAPVPAATAKAPTAPPAPTPAVPTKPPAPPPPAAAAPTPAPPVSPPAAAPVPTAKPVTPVAPTPTAAPTVSLPSVPTAAKVAVGAAAVSMASAVAAAESGSNYDVAFGDRFDKRLNKKVNAYGLKTPEDFLQKPLTEFTLEEVQQFQIERNKQREGTGAVGAFQFMPTTLFGRKGRDGKLIPGLVQQLELPMTTKFNKETQEKLFDLLYKKDVATLKRLNVPITPGYEYMAHYIGAGGASVVYKAVQANQDITVAQALTAAGQKIGVNPELEKIKVQDFENVLADRLKKKGGYAPHSVGNVMPNAQKDTGNQLDSASKENKDLKRQSATPATPNAVVLNTVNNVTNGSKIYQTPTEDKNTSPVLQNQYK